MKDDLVSPACEDHKCIPIFRLVLEASGFMVTGILSSPIVLLWELVVEGKIPSQENMAFDSWRETYTEKVRKVPYQVKQPLHLVFLDFDLQMRRLLVKCIILALYLYFSIFNSKRNVLETLRRREWEFCDSMTQTCVVYAFPSKPLMRTTYKSIWKRIFQLWTKNKNITNTT